jgi:hypothetical protein
MEKTMVRIRPEGEAYGVFPVLENELVLMPVTGLGDALPESGGFPVPFVMFADEDAGNADEEDDMDEDDFDGIGDDDDFDDMDDDDDFDDDDDDFDDDEDDFDYEEDVDYDDYDE